jgi:ABC-type uncharacterized transport system permease subunit
MILASTLSAALLYGLAAFGWLRSSDAAAPRWPGVAIIAALIAQAFQLYALVLADGQLHLGFGNTFSLIAWLTVLVYGFASLKQRLLRISGWISVLGLLGSLMPLIFADSRVLPNSDSLALRVHLVVSLLAYSFFFIAALQALLMATFERRLHQAVAMGALGGLPPLLTLESMLFRLIGIGFALLTLALGSGVFFSEEFFGQPMPINHKTVFAVLSWGVFGALLMGRLLWGWRGRTATRWTLAGFVMLVLAYMGSKFVLEVMLSR